MNASPSCRHLALAGLLLSSPLMDGRAQACFAPPTYAQFGPLVTQLATSARTLALGGANVAGRDDDVIFADPAQIAIARGTSASIERYTPRTVAGAGSSVTRIGSGGIAFGLTAVQFDAPPCIGGADLTNFAAGGGSLGTSAEALIGFAQTIKGFRIGVTGKYAAEQLNEARFGAALADVGVSRDVNWFGDAPFSAAMAVQNIGGDIRPMPGSVVQAPLRAVVGLAGGAPIGTFDVGVTTQLSARRDGFVAPAGGIELGYVWIEGYALAGRIGARRPDAGEGPLTFGAGLNADRLSIDYAVESLSGAKWGQRVGFRVR